MDSTGIRRLELLLRAGVALCFIGHGAFGLLRKEAWLSYFTVFGIDASTAYTLMPIVGSIDIAVGLLVLAWPTRALLAYGVFWCTLTAALRPLAGESVWEVLERAGNYGAPLALLVWLGSRSDLHGWFRRVRSTELEPQRIGRVLHVARWATAALLVGHGMLALARKPLLVEHMATLGLGADAVVALGLIDLALAALCVARPVAVLFGGIFVWKLGTEALFIMSGAPVWEFVERGGSYALPLAVAIVLAPGRRTAAPTRRTAAAMRRPVIAGVLLLSVTLSAAPAAAQAAGRRPAATAALPRFDDSTARALRSGGYVLACRHGITDDDASDRQPVRFDDPSTQRILNAAGERQMAEAGRHIAVAGFPFTDVRTSPYQRTHRSAVLMFGSATVDSALYGGGAKRAAREPLFHGVVAPGTNRVLMTHQGPLYDVLPLRRGTIEEGDCIMVRPTGSALEMIAHIKPDDWARHGVRR